RGGVDKRTRRHRRRRRGRRERPSRCAAEKRDELAPVAKHGEFLPCHLASLPTGIQSPEQRYWSVCRRLNLPQNGRQVLGSYLNRSESRWRLPVPPCAYLLDSPERYSTRLLHCGISIWSMSALGQSLPIDMTATRAQCPLHLP